MKAKRKITLKKKFLLLYGGFVFLPFLVLCYYFLATFTQYLEENIIYRSQAGFEQTNQLIAYYMYNVNFAVNDLGNSDILHKIIEKDENTLEAEQKSAEANQLRNLLAGYRMKNEIEDLVLYVNADASYVGMNSIVQHMRVVSDTEWYNRVMKTVHGSELIPSSVIEKEDAISYIKRLRHSNNYTLTVGILRIDISKLAITDMLKQSLQSSEDFAYIINKRGEMVCESGEVIAYVPFEDIESYNNDKPHRVELENSVNIVYVESIDNTDWYLVYTIPYTNILSKLYSQISMFLILCILLATMGFVFVYFFFKLFLNRVSLIKDHMSNVQTQLPPPLEEPKHVDEISDLTEAYNYMLSRVDVLLKEQYSLGNQIREAEMKALYEQINPHFLYNTLGLIAWLAEEGQQEDIQEVINALSNFYRLSLNKGSEYIYMREELMISEAFVYIQNMRYGTNILLEQEIDDIYDEIILPKLTLQPLVENALVHGILMRRDKSGFIKVGVKSDKTNICITIKDNGIGIAEDRLKELNKGTLQSSGKHYGVKNIMQRLTLYYGRECSLIYESEGGETRAILMIPYY